MISTKNILVFKEYKIFYLNFKLLILYIILLTININPLASPSSGAPAFKYGDVNTETTSPGEVKGLIIIMRLILILKIKKNYQFN